MYERLLSETQRYLERHKDDLIAVKTLWKFITAEGKRSNFAVPSLTDFACLLDGDKRFEFVALIDGVEMNESELDEDLLEHEELGKLGFKEQQHVRLRKQKLEDDEDSENETVPAMIPLNDDMAFEESQDAFEDMIFSPAKNAIGGRKRKNTEPPRVQAKSTPKSVLRKVLSSVKKKTTVKKSSQKKRKK